MSRRTARVAAVAAIIGCAAFVSCATEVGTADRSTATQESGSSAGAPAPPAEQLEDEVDAMTPIRISVDGQVIEARLWDNLAAKSLIDQLPLTLDFSDYGGQEVLAEPPQPLTMEGMPAGESAPAGTIGYYGPDRVIVLYYVDVPSYPGIVRIGEIDGDLLLLRGWGSARQVTIEAVAR